MKNTKAFTLAELLVVLVGVSLLFYVVFYNGTSDGIPLLLLASIMGLVVFLCAKFVIYLYRKRKSASVPKTPSVGAPAASRIGTLIIDQKGGTDRQ